MFKINILTYFNFLIFSKIVNWAKSTAMISIAITHTIAGIDDIIIAVVDTIEAVDDVIASVDTTDDVGTMADAVHVLAAHFNTL